MHLLDRLIAPFAPGWALARTRDRHILAAYEAARPSRTRANPADNRSGDATLFGVAQTLRGQARHLDQNHDLARGVLNCLVNNVVGAKGIGIEFQPKHTDGQIHTEFADELQKVFDDWAMQPESTGEYTWSKLQRLMARAWFRDGEVLAKSLLGDVPKLNHRTKVPYTLELIEADYLAEIDDPNNNITQGVERNAWGRPVYYHLHKTHPGDHGSYRFETRKVNADVIDHIKTVDRIRQARGVTVFAAVMNRLNDIKDYEESERVAARVSAAMTAYIKKGSPDMYGIGEGSGEGRAFSMAPGMIFDNLQPGEEVGTIDTNRPSALLQPFRDAMLKAVAAGVGTSYSTIAKNYDGTYSAQRQELVEQWVNYSVLADEFINMFVAKVQRRFVTMAIASGVVTVPKNVDRDSLYHAEFICPSMPWIDPAKEAKGHELNLQLKLKSPQQIIRSTGAKPEDVLDQWERWNEELKKRGIPATHEPAQAGFLTPGENSHAEK